MPLGFNRRMAANSTLSYGTATMASWRSTATIGTLPTLKKHARLAMDVLVQDEPRRQRRRHESERRQWPDQTDIALRQQVGQRAEENRFERDAEQDAGIDRAAADRPPYLHDGNFLRLTNLLQPAA